MAAGYILSTHPKTTTKHASHKVLDLLICMLTIVICSKQFLFIYGQYLIAQPKQIEHEKLLSISEIIGTSEIYYRTVALQLIRKKDWKGTIEHCDKALKYTLRPSVLQMKANALLQENKSEEAEITLQLLRHMIPTHLGCKFQLLQFYYRQHNSKKAHDMAHEILSIKPQIESKETKRIKQATQHYLNHIHHEHEH